MSRIVPTAATASTPQLTNVDIESIVRRVIAQLHQQNDLVADALPAAASRPVINQRVLSLHEVREIPSEVKQIMVSRQTVITPAAKDELRLRGITFEKSNLPSQGVVSKPQHASGTRAVDLQRDGGVSEGTFSAVKRQVLSRGVRLCDAASVTVILSDRPATTAHLRINPESCIVSINRIDDVPRFISELSPNVFVLDVLHLHLVSLATAIAAIARPAATAQSGPPKVTVSGGLS